MRQLPSRGALCIEITFVGATISRTLCISQYKATLCRDATVPLNGSLVCWYEMLYFNVLSTLNRTKKYFIHNLKLLSTQKKNRIRLSGSYF